MMPTSTEILKDLTGKKPDQRNLMRNLISGHRSGRGKKLTNSHNSLKKISPTSNTKENCSNQMSKLRRKDLEFDEFTQQKEWNLAESNFS